MVSPMDHENLRLRERRPWKLARMWLFGHAAKGDTGQAPHPRRSRAIPACSRSKSGAADTVNLQFFVIGEIKHSISYCGLVNVKSSYGEYVGFRAPAAGPWASSALDTPLGLRSWASFTRSPGAVSKYPNAL
jgi:hypothetical protein